MRITRYDIPYTLFNGCQRRSCLSPLHICFDLATTPTTSTTSTTSTTTAACRSMQRRRKPSNPRARLDDMRVYTYEYICEEEEEKEDRAL